MAWKSGKLYSARGYTRSYMCSELMSEVEKDEAAEASLNQRLGSKKQVTLPLASCGNPNLH